MKNLNPIHQNPQQRQESATEKTTEAVNVASETIVEAIKNIPKAPDITPNLKSVAGELSSKLDELNSEQKELLRNLIDEVKSGALPAQMEGVESVMIGNDMTETNELLQKLLEENKVPCNVSIKLNIV